MVQMVAVVPFLAGSVLEGTVARIPVALAGFIIETGIDPVFSRPGIRDDDPGLNVPAYGSAKRRFRPGTAD